MTVTFMGLDCVADMDTDAYQEHYTISQSGTHAWAYQAKYGVGMCYFGVVLLFLVVLRKLAYLYADWGYRNTKLGHKLLRSSIVDKLAGVSRFVSYRRIPLMLCRITGMPANVGTLTVYALSLAYILCLCFAPGYLMRPCRGFGSPPLSVRTGIMSTALTPFLIVMSGKTNFISFVTGISYEKLNIFHQGLGWAALLLAMIHTFPFLVQSHNEGGMSRVKYMWDTNIYFKNGVPPLIFLFLLCILSTRLSRGLVYEAWFHCHWFFGVAYIATLWYHVYDALASDKYLWATMAFWGFQMLYRVVVKTTFKPNQFAFKSKVAKLTPLANGAYEVSVTIKGSKELDWMPGQHIFIRFMHGLHTLDNHPFSILTVPNHSNQKSQLKLIVKPQKGLTRKLYEMLQDEKSGKELRCFIDGPYGGMNRDPLAFDKLVLVSTGTGVSVTAPFLSYVAKKLGSASSCVQKVELLWAVRSVESVDWIRNELMSVLSEAASVESLSMFDIKIFVSGSEDGSTPELITSRSQLPHSSGSSSDDESNQSVKESDAEELSTQIKIFENSKPDFYHILQETKLLNKTAFICSGTGSVQEACGNAVSSLQTKVLSGETQEVYLHTENFGW